MIRKALIVVFLLLALGYVNYQAVATERQISNGRTVLLQLAPADPRSLLQGDFMRLGYQIDADFRIDDTPTDTTGQIILTLDRNDVGQYAGKVRASDDVVLQPNQLVVNYRAPSEWDVQIAPDSFFFQEGAGEIFEAAEYAETRITPDGRVFLIALRDENFRVLGE